MASIGPRTESPARLLTRGWLLAVPWFVVVGGVVVLRVWALVPHVWDLGFFVHGLAAVARGGLDAPVPFAGWTVLEDHFSPLLLALAPLARFDWSAYLLVAVQAAAVALSIPIAWRMARRATHSPRDAWLLTLAYALSPVLLFAVFFDIHASVLAAPLLLLVFEGIDEVRPAKIIVAGSAAVLLREDVAFFMLVLAVVFFAEARTPMLALGGISASALLIGRIVAGGRDPALTPPHVGFSYDYIDIGDPIGTAAGGVEALFVGGTGALALVLIAIAIPWIGFWRQDWKAVLYGALVAAPFLLSQYSVTKSVSSHYYFALAPILFWGATRGTRGGESAGPPGLRRRLAVLGVAIGALGGPLVFGALASNGATTAIDVIDMAVSERSRIAATHDALGCLPDHFSLAVGPELTPHVPDHEMVWQWPQPVDEAVWILGGNRFTLESIDPTGWPEAVVFARSAYAPGDYGYHRVGPASGGVHVFVRGGVDATEVSACLSSG